MAIALFEHNARAYNAAVSMLSETGKACVVHPTGTGKSFIGFKLCEDHPGARICWLSPSEYIFKTQLENLAATGAEVPENIAFFTYARLMLMDDAELAEIRPDYIVLDEFHRCGAEQWGAGVQRLLAAYPEAALLGLSATNIRYLDDQRDMAGELFDGNVASEMTLGDAIVRGILNAPTYVLSVFAYQKDYDVLKARVHRARNKAVQDEAERYLEALRRALEQADGLDVIFDKHMTDRAGKYLVFCANAEHMREMMAHVPEWFGKIDAAPHVYSAYSDDPETSQAFSDFKADESNHLKLLFCIDMLNEGIHIKGVSGVILFRPTVSPIVYKQQIGRALSATKTGEPVIFDIVNNIENLYSIGSLEEEVEAAASFYRFRGEASVIVNERFHVIDEVGDARELFERLNDTLTASWELMYEYAKAYYEEYGDLKVPFRYRTKEGYSLGNWIKIQRDARSGRQQRTLDARRIALLDEIGMVWVNESDLSWQQYYEALCRYRAQHGDLNIKTQYVDENGIPLGKFLANLRASRRDGRRSAFLTEERIRQLDELGMIWEKLDYAWERHYQACVRYYREHGNLDVPSSYVQDGYRIGYWLRRQRRRRQELSPDHVKRLEDIGMVWSDSYSARWEEAYEQAKQYYLSHGDLKIPKDYRTDDGRNLCNWVRRHRQARKKGTLTREQIEKLDEIGMEWETGDLWEIGFSHASAYYAKHQNLNVRQNWVDSDGYRLGVWISTQRSEYLHPSNNGGLSKERIRRLEAIGMVWSPWQEQWMTGYRHAEQYLKALNGLPWKQSYVSPEDQFKTGEWLKSQQRQWKQGSLKPERRKALESIGVIFGSNRDGEKENAAI